MVVNLDDCIAITQNYVSASNLSDVLRFLRDKEDQISGVRDRPQEAVQAEELYTEFIAKMRENRDNTHITDEQLDQCIADSFRPSDLETLDGSSGNSKKRTLAVNKKNRPRKKQTTTASSEDSKQSGRTASPSNVALLVDSEGESSEASRQTESTSTSFSFSFSF
jgi:tetrahydrodipicolinate N-succinyltransferase